MITKKRIPFKPREYEWAYDYWFKQQNAHWLHTEIDMKSDVKNWREDLSVEEKNVIGNILKGFAQTECEVEDYWSSKVTKWFPKPEIKMMAVTFGAWETIHAEAYSYLNETLGLDDFEGFLEDEATMNKLQVLMDINTVPKLSQSTDSFLRSVAVALAIFSACAEGIQLFSSFAVLLSFRRSNRLKGIGQQMIYSVRDESLHSEAGCKLFRVLMSEHPEIWDDQLKQEIYQGFELALGNEFHYLNKIFEMGDLPTITKEQVKNFMYDRANRKLLEIGLKEKYLVDPELLKEMDWFYPTVSGVISTDFFDNKETGYSKPNEDWNDEGFWD